MKQNVIGVLAVQGAFIEHVHALANAGAQPFEIRQLRDLDRPMDGLVLPGGESTVQGKLLRDLGLFNPLQEMIRNGLPVFATCAGLILLAREIADDPTVWFGTLPVTVRRNAYGRQLGSFSVTDDWNGLPQVPMTFIRAPSIESVSPDVEILSSFQGKATSVRYRNILGFTWHPELSSDLRPYQTFLKEG